MEHLDVYTELCITKKKIIIITTDKENPQQEESIVAWYWTTDRSVRWFLILKFVCFLLFL